VRTGKQARRPETAALMPVAPVAEADAPLSRLGAFARAVSALPSRRSLRGSDRDLAQLLLADLLALSADRAPTFISVDIFDTLLLRDDKCEARRFWEISALVRQRIASSDLHAERSTHDLFVARYLAMRAGYACSDRLRGCQEGHIVPILATQAELLDLPSSAQDLFLDAELEFEACNLQSNDFLLAVLQQAFADKPLIGLSDTYLGAAQIETLVARVCGGRCRLHALYSSADIILNKRSGHAFAHVAHDRNAACDEFLHVGDNVSSDLIPAHRSGWRALLFPVTHTELEARSRDLERFLEERRREGHACEAYATL
jgi:FMN phosphatase YigB (HAD superfamily)